MFRSLFFHNVINVEAGEIPAGTLAPKLAPPKTWPKINYKYWRGLLFLNWFFKILSSLDLKKHWLFIAGCNEKPGLLFWEVWKCFFGESGNSQTRFPSFFCCCLVVVEDIAILITGNAQERSIFLETLLRSSLYPHPIKTFCDSKDVQKNSSRR